MIQDNRLLERITWIRNRIAEVEIRNTNKQVTIVAVSKNQSAEVVRQAYYDGLTVFGENYLQEALPKIKILNDLPIEWHFIGHIQTNKARIIANHFSWVQSVCRAEVAYLLNKNRIENLPPLNCLIQVNVDNEVSKSGIVEDDVLDLTKTFADFPRLKLRGLMVIPKPCENFEQQRATFRKINELFLRLKELGYHLDTLSMGMSDDYEAAIIEGATMVRIGTKIFGPRT